METSMADYEYFPGVGPIRFEGADAAAPLAFRYYDADRLVAGRKMRDQLRFAVCWWHSFSWHGSDVFGAPTRLPPWLRAGDSPLEAARRQADAAFEFFTKLGVDFFTFHDRDVAPEGADFAESQDNFRRMVDVLEQRMAGCGKRLLWGTANLFGHPRYAAGAATSADPEVFACAAAQVADALEATHRLGGANYVLWGGREGYETLLNTDLKRERQQLARFLAMVAEHKAKIGFTGTLLIEPKPFEPTKHQYDFDAAAVHGFLLQFGLADQFRLNIEANHATLAGHSFPHEIAYAIGNGIFGSIDANRGDPQLGWDTDQFPNDVAEAAQVMWLILKGGGLGTGGFNFDAKLRRASIRGEDPFHAHIGGMDTIARGLLVAERILADGRLDAFVEDRYAGWRGALGRDILEGRESLGSLRTRVAKERREPTPASGRQEYLENLFGRFL
jgi:xylose isomerase